MGDNNDIQRVSDLEQVREEHNSESQSNDILPLNQFKNHSDK